MISIIIPNFDDFRIKRTFDSIIRQGTDNLEVIVQEGCINGLKTKAIYEEYSRLDYISIFKEEDDGIFDAFNRGIQKAKGDLIYLIGSDDYLIDDDIIRKVQEARISGPYDIISIGCKMFKGEELKRVWKIDEPSVKEILNGKLPPHLGLFISPTVYDNIGLFDWEDMYDGCDSMWLIKLAVKAPNTRFKALKDTYMAMEIGGHSTGSVSNIISANKNLYTYSKSLRVKRPFLLVLNKLIIKIIQSI